MILKGYRFKEERRQKLFVKKVDGIDECYDLFIIGARCLCVSVSSLKLCASWQVLIAWMNQVNVDQLKGKEV